MTVYADVLLLVNFSMDFLTLYFTGRLLHRPVKMRRFAAAAFVGSAGGTVRTILESDPSAAGTLFIGFLLSALMVLIAFGICGSFVTFLADCFAVWGCGVFLGGIMTWLMHLGEPVYTAKNNSGITFTALVIASFAVISAALRIFQKHRAQKSCEVTVDVCGEHNTFSTLCDSGNLASDPLSGLPVIIVRSGILEKAERELAAGDHSLRIRVIPISGIGGESVNIGFIPDKITVDGIEAEAVILITKNTGKFAGFDGILPAVLCR